MGITYIHAEQIPAINFDQLFHTIQAQLVVIFMTVNDFYNSYLFLRCFQHTVEKRSNTGLWTSADMAAEVITLWNAAVHQEKRKR